MTKAASVALQLARADIESIITSLTEEEWERPSACAGWRVRDVIAHMAAVAKEAIDPTPLSPDDPPLPENRERQHDIRVDQRRGWTTEQVLDEYRTYTAEFAELIASRQEEPAASRTWHVPGLGTYPMHALANAIVFDAYCHLRIDILKPAGPIDRTLLEPTHELVYPAIQWMMWGLPQMQGPDLAETVTAPITIELTGPGASTWTITRADAESPLVVDEAAGGVVTVVSLAHDFIGWGTKRSDWREHCTLRGNSSAEGSSACSAEPFLDALNII